MNNRRTVPINPMLCHNIKFKITTTWRGLLWDHIGCTMLLSDFAFSWDITKTFTDFHLRPSAPSWAALCEVRQILGFSPTGPPRCGLLWVPVAVQLPPPIIRRPSWTSDFFAINSINRVFNGMTQTTLGIDNLFWPHPKIAQIAKAPSLYWPIIPRILSIQMTR